MEKLKVIYLPLSKLTPDPQNAKLHPQEQIEEIKHSIKEFSMCDPIGIAGQDNKIIEGHGRYLALQDLGVKEAPCIRLDHLDTEERQKAYAIIHNKTTMDSGFDIELLDVNLAEIETIDMGLYGFGESEEQPNDIESAAGFSEKYNVIIECANLNEAEALAKLLHVDLDFTRQKISCKYSDISV